MRAAALLPVLLLAACGGQPAEPAPAAPSTSVAALPEVPGVAASALRYRSDEAVGGQVQVHVENTGTEPFTVTSVQLDTPGFAPVPAREVSTVFAPGRGIDLPASFGAVSCAVAPAPAAARLTVLRPAGVAEELVVPLAGDTMARVHTEECAVQDVLAVVGVAVEQLVDDGSAVTADVVLTRRSGDDEVVVSALLPSVVLEPVPDVELPVRLTPDAEELRLPVTFDAERCDPHALAETKKPFVFPLVVTVGEGADVPVDLPLEAGQQALLEEFLGRACR